MRINSPRRRKAISPVLATVILIAITLIAAIAIAGFVFGLFGTFTSGANLQLSATYCLHDPSGNVAGDAYCKLSITNTGGATGSVTGCVIYGLAGVSGTTIPPITAATVAVPAGTTSGAPVSVYCSAAAGIPGSAIVAGAAVTGQLVVASGAPLAFSAIAS